MAKLMNDVTRCHDDTCKDNQQCERYLQRLKVGARTPNVMTFMNHTYCGYKITHIKMKENKY